MHDSYQLTVVENHGDRHDWVMTDQSQFRTPQEIEASFLEDAYPGADFWEVEKSFEVKVRVIAEAETPEEEPSVSFAR